ncbi:hypothetical protein CR513_07517, partial [Mucuna pruriens]
MQFCNNRRKNTTLTSPSPIIFVSYACILTTFTFSLSFVLVLALTLSLFGSSFSLSHLCISSRILTAFAFSLSLFRARARSSFASVWFVFLSISSLHFFSNLGFVGSDLVSIGLTTTPTRPGNVSVEGGLHISSSEFSIKFRLWMDKGHARKA